MARSITTIPQKSISFIDPWDQPAFTVFSGTNGDKGFITYNHRLDIHNWDHGTEGYSSFRSSSGSQYTSEWINNYSSNTEFMTNSVTSTGSNRSQLTSHVGYLGHQNFMRPSAKGIKSGWFKSSNSASYAASAFRDCGVIVNEIYQNYAIFANRVGSSNAGFYALERDPFAYYNASNQGYSRHTATNIPVRTAGYEFGYGSMCYNAKTNKLLIMEDSSSTYYFRPVVWDNVPDLRSIANNKNTYYDKAVQYNAHSTSSLQDWFSNTSNQPSADKYALMTSKPRTYSSEDRYRIIPVLCDNGRVVAFQMLPNGNPGAWITRWNSPDENNPGQWQGSLRTFSGTTSYGMDQGNLYGARWQVTSDGRYIAAYCPYYYYGSGIHVAFIRVSDGKYLYGTSTDTSYGFAITPLGKSDFFFSYCVNADGAAGLLTNQVNMDDLFAKNADGANVSSSTVTGINYTYWLDTFYYSTAYPTIIPAYYDTSLFTNSLS